MNGACKGERLTISREPMTMGRDPSCSISLKDDPEAALKHCLIEHTAHDELMIRDSGSMNRVLVNNHEVSETKLKHGDIIEAGRTRLLVQAFVQADIKNNGGQPKRKKSRRILTRTLIACSLAALSLAGYYKVRDIINNAHSEPEPHEFIPPQIFRDLKASEPAPGPQKNPTALIDKVIEQKPGPAPEPEKPAPEPVSVTETADPPAPHPAPPAANKEPPPAPAPVPAKKSLPPVVIIDLNQQKFPQQPDYDEMRVASVKLKTSGSKIEDSKVSVQFEFFDKDLATGEITSARAIVPLKPVQTTLLAANGEETISATYTVPKGLRAVRANNSGYAFYGVRAVVTYDGEVVAQRAIPITLLKKEE